MKKAAAIVTDSASFLFILLFTYTATDKTIHYKAFKGAVMASPLIKNFAASLPAIIIAAEWITVLLLLIPALRWAGLYAAFSLMLLFTVYIACMLATATDLPCSCGGILRQLTWKQHLWVNGLLTGLALLSTLLVISSKKETKSLLQ